MPPAELTSVPSPPVTDQNQIGSTENKTGATETKRPSAIQGKTIF